MEIYTTGFTKKSAKTFFGALIDAGIEQLVDVRINNTSQLAGFAKRDDLDYFLRELVGASYIHEPLLAPTRELLKSFRQRDVDWDEYQVAFLELMRERRVETELSRDLFSRRTVLLCSENEPEHCHRRLVVEYLALHWGEMRAVHL